MVSVTVACIMDMPCQRKELLALVLLHGECLESVSHYLMEFQYETVHLSFAADIEGRPPQHPISVSFCHVKNQCERKVDGQLKAAECTFIRQVDPCRRVNFIRSSN